MWLLLLTFPKHATKCHVIHKEHSIKFVQRRLDIVPSLFGVDHLGTSEAPFEIL